jgi:hypothetical protein
LLVLLFINQNNWFHQFLQLIYWVCNNERSFGTQKLFNEIGGLVETTKWVSVDWCFLYKKALIKPFG